MVERVEQDAVDGLVVLDCRWDTYFEVFSWAGGSNQSSTTVLSDTASSFARGLCVAIASLVLLGLRYLLILIPSCV